MLMPSNITLCADDFGLSKGISESIVLLAQKKRLNAVSCMVNGVAFKTHAAQLLSEKEHVQIGLHFHLTELPCLSTPQKSGFKLSTLLLLTHLRLISIAWLRQEFEAQLDLFIHIMGRMPDFIDGHQHVHQFPQVRQAMLLVYEARLRQYNTYVRCTYPAIAQGPYRRKAAILAWTGGRGLKKLLVQNNIPHNELFAGIYDFAPNTDYQRLFRQWVSSASEKTLIMCHPGTNDVLNDAIAHARSVEMAYFLSDDFKSQDFQIK